MVGLFFNRYARTWLSRLGNTTHSDVTSALVGIATGGRARPGRRRVQDLDTLGMTAGRDAHAAPPNDVEIARLERRVTMADYSWAKTGAAEAALRTGRME